MRNQVTAQRKVRQKSVPSVGRGFTVMVTIALHFGLLSHAVTAVMLRWLFPSDFSLMITYIITKHLLVSRGKTVIGGSSQPAMKLNKLLVLLKINN